MASNSKEQLSPEGLLKEAIAKCPLEPLGARCVVLKDNFQYGGLIVIPENAKRAPTTGVVLKVGPNWDKESGAQVGSRVLVGIYGGTGVVFRGHPIYSVMNQDEIITLVTKTDAELAEVGV
jgi:co-chaperonin GroES (HSP10)